MPDTLRLDAKKRVKGLPQEVAARHQSPISPPKYATPSSSFKIPKTAKHTNYIMSSPLQSPNKKSKHSLCFSPNHTAEQKKTLIDIKKFFQRVDHTLYINYGKKNFGKCNCLSNSAGNVLAAASFKLLDTESGWNFLIDTGACRSFVPKPKKTIINLSPYEGPPIVTANGQPLKTYASI